MKGANLLQMALLLLSLTLDQAVTQCHVTPPCQSCDAIAVLRDSQNCRRYFYCFYGSPSSALLCRRSQIFSTQRRRCVSNISANECRSNQLGSSQFYSYNNWFQRRKGSYPSSQTSQVGYPYTKPQSQVYGSVGPIINPSAKRFPYFPSSGGGVLQLPGSARYLGNPSGFYPGTTGDNAQALQPRESQRVRQSENCGVKSSNWIVGGQESYPGAWPWQVSLQEYDVTLGRWVHVCGGALVHESWVVTAGHCAHALSAAEAVSAVLGSYNLSATAAGEQRLRVDRLVTHPRYSHGGNYPNDVGLAHLTAPASITRSVSPVCLPDQEAATTVESGGGSTLHGPGSQCWVTGWGRTLGRTDSHVLNEAEVEMVSREECLRSWTGYITFSHVCAAGRGRAGACEGDSGGPLTCLRAGRYYLEGVVSWGEDSCQLASYPSVFTRVALYTHWIRQTVAAAGYP